MKLPYTFLEPYCWDQRFIKDALQGIMWEPVNSSLNNSMVFIVPGAYWTPVQVNEKIQQYKHVIVIITSDEENLFDYKQLTHNSIKVWIQTPRANVDYGDDIRLFGVGYGDKYIATNLKYSTERPIDVFVSAQNTHERRHMMFEKLTGLPTETVKIIQQTDGFLKGMPAKEYHHLMSGAKICPAPSGVVSPDSFRFYEALEHGCIPIADDISPTYNSEGYWMKLYPNSNFPILKTYNSILGYTQDLLTDWTPKSNRIFAWWQGYKRQFCYNLIDDLRGLGAQEVKSDKIIDRLTVIIPSSPIPSHRSTAIIEETIASIRHHLPDCEIIITLDGVREQQNHRRADYEEYIRALLYLSNNVWHNVLPIIFDEHMHQAKMLREVLPKVKTANILYVEQDTPLVIDEGGIEWSKLLTIIESGEANLIRFLHEAAVHPEHYHMKIGEPVIFDNVRLQRTIQWSQRPHLASKVFYENILNAYFHPESKTMIEDVMHGRVQMFGSDLSAWGQFRLYIYLPQGNAKRSYHTDGRENDEKYEMDIVEVES